MKKTILPTLVSMAALTAFMGCVKLDESPTIPIEEENVIEDGPMAGLNVSATFDYSTSKTIEVRLMAPEFLRGAGFSFYLGTDDEQIEPFASASFDSDGKYHEHFTIPAIQDSITIRSNYVGLTDNVTLSVAEQEVTYDYRENYKRGSTVTAKSNNGSFKTGAFFEQDGFTFLSPFDAMGVPENLLNPDLIAQNLLDDINASLPENRKLPESHPEYLAGKETNIILVKEADVWVTFVSEGAGYRNTLGYYTYPLGQEPQTIAEIAQHNVIFPNVSMKNSGGGLLPGDRVYLGRFPANTVVSWFLVANGFTGNGVNAGNDTHYSQNGLNKEADPDLKTHMVLLHDKARELTILGFEDILRDRPNCDQDFNDAIFYAKSNPVDAIASENLASIDTSNDADGDGVNDELDYFPYDPNIAFNNFAPSADATGSLAYEDLWPSKGDYDFNDLVVKYNYNLLANSAGKITKIEATYDIENIGGAFHNGFAITFPIPSNQVADVKNQVLTKGYLNIDDNGTESGTASGETVIVIADDTYDLFGQRLNIEITFDTPLDKVDLGPIPFNPFIIVDGEREKEVHLPDLRPTSKAKYLGEKDDFSEDAKGRFYKTRKNLPWALNM